MEDLLTTRQVLEYLKVDRITVYRMLNDGRLKGIKIGQHWRFSHREIERLLKGEPTLPEPGKPEPKPNFPTHCVQTIQDLFSEVGQVNALIVDPQGEPLTTATHPCSFCELIQRSPAGIKACQTAWRMLAQDSDSGSQPYTCHAGLQYVSAPITDDGNPVGTFLSGQFYWQTPDPQEEVDRLRRLAVSHDLPFEQVQLAAGSIPVISPDQHTRVAAWPLTAARAVQSILRERTGFMTRLQKISDLTQIP
jgi:excisionase family DNA binding protein